MAHTHTHANFFKNFFNATSHLCLSPFVYLRLLNIALFQNRPSLYHLNAKRPPIQRSIQPGAFCLVILSSRVVAEIATYQLTTMI